MTQFPGIGIMIPVGVDEFDNILCGRTRASFIGTHLAGHSASCCMGTVWYGKVNHRSVLGDSTQWRRLCSLV